MKMPENTSLLKWSSRSILSGVAVAVVYHWQLAAFYGRQERFNKLICSPTFKLRRTLRMAL